MFIAEYLNTSYGDFSQHVNTTNTHQAPQGEEIGAATENPMTKSEFTTVYILVGLGPIVTLFLFVTLMQLCKKFKNARRQTRTVENKKCVLLNQSPHKSREPGHASFNILNTEPSIKQFETGYEEINDVSEIHQLDVFNASDGYETPETSSRNIPHQRRNSVSCASVNDGFCDQKREKIHADVNNYLTPLFL